MATGNDGRGEGDAGVSSPSAAATTGRRAGVDSGADTAAATPEELASAGAGASAGRSVTGRTAAGRAATDRVEENLIGTILEQRYEVTRRIGQGGMGAVFEATHKLLGKRVAVKVLLDKYADKDSLVARLEQEARLASSIGHPNIIDITDFGQTADGRTYVVMEFLEGESLGALIVREGKLPIDRAVRIARQIASALDAAHAKGVVHRDLKPENVFLVRRGDADFVKVVDFGISKLMRPEAGEDTPRLTQTGMVLGTPLYMSPEQARGDEQLDHKIDVYALGVILYEMVTAEVPFRGTNYLAILSQVVSEEPIPPRRKDPTIPPELEAIILKALAKDPRRRYQSMGEVGEDLAILLTMSGSVASTGARISAMRGRPRRRPPVGLVLAVIVVVGAAAVALIRPFGEDDAGGRAPGAEAEAAAPDEAAAAAAEAEAAPDEPTGVGPAPAGGPPVEEVETVEITIVSTPPGAQIYEGDRHIGVSPFTKRMVKRDKEVVFYLEKGALSGKTTINPIEIDGREPIAVRLGRGRATRPAPTTPPIAAPAGADDTAGGDLTGDPHRD